MPRIIIIAGKAKVLQCASPATRNDGMRCAYSTRRWISRSCARGVLALTVLKGGLSAETSPPASDLVSNQHVLAFLTQTVDWYRHRAIERQIATDPVDLAFTEDNRLMGAQILQLSFEFARADASLAAMSATSNEIGPGATKDSPPELTHFLELEKNADLATQQAKQQIEAIKTKLLTARRAERPNLQAALDATQSRLDLLQAGLASLHDVVEFVRTSRGRQTGDLESSIDELAQSVPEMSNPVVAGPQTRNSDIAFTAKPQGSGILGLSADVSALGNKISILDEEIGRTEKLRQSSEHLRLPLLAYANNYFPTAGDNYLQATDLRALEQQKTELDALRLLAKALAPAMVTLDKQKLLLADYSSHLKSWRAAVVSEDEKAWRNLILRLVLVVAVISGLIMMGAISRRVTDRHVRDAGTRHMARVIERVVLWFTILLVLAFSFASDLRSLATFFGLLTAGMAVALQSVILATLGYFVLVGRRGIKIGDRVRISGVTGDVTDIGWLQFRLAEIDTATQQPTGHIVTFSNSFVFASPATGLSKFNQHGSQAPPLKTFRTETPITDQDMERQHSAGGGL